MESSKYAVTGDSININVVIEFQYAFLGESGKYVQNISQRRHTETKWLHLQT